MDQSSLVICTYLGLEGCSLGGCRLEPPILDSACHLPASGGLQSGRLQSPATDFGSRTRVTYLSLGGYSLGGCSLGRPILDRARHLPESEGLQSGGLQSGPPILDRARHLPESGGLQPGGLQSERLQSRATDFGVRTPLT